jgi:hypothetical protein
LSATNDDSGVSVVIRAEVYGGPCDSNNTIITILDWGKGVWIGGKSCGATPYSCSVILSYNLPAFVFCVAVAAAEEF